MRKAENRSFTSCGFTVGRPSFSGEPGRIFTCSSDGPRRCRNSRTASRISLAPIDAEGCAVICCGRDLREAHGRRGGLLPAGGIMDFVIENDVEEILRLIKTNCRERPHFHERRPVAVDHHHRLARQGVRYPKANGRSGSHPAHDIKMIRPIRHREELAPGFSGSRDDRFIAVERGENQFERLGAR